MKYAGVVIRRNACGRGNRWIPANDEQYPQAQRLEMLRRSPAYRITQGSRPALKEGGTANARLHSSILRVMTSKPTCSQQPQLRSRTRTPRLIEVQASEKQSASMHSSSRPRAFNALRSKVAGVHSDEVVRHDSQHGKTPECVRKVVQLSVVDHCYTSRQRRKILSRAEQARTEECVGEAKCAVVVAARIVVCIYLERAPRLSCRTRARLSSTRSAPSLFILSSLYLTPVHH